MADRDDMIRKVQALWAKADDAATTEHEREAFIAKARDLMAKYTIDEMVLNEAKAAGAREDVILMDIRVTKDGEAENVADQATLLAHFIGTHNRCRQVIQNKMATVKVDGTPVAGGTFLTVVGYRSDCEMVRDLYMNLAMDMMMACMDEPTGHMKKRERDNYFANFCDGFAMRINSRLAEINRRVHEVAEETGGMALVLRSREAAVQDTFTQMFPNLKNVKLSAVKNDPSAQARGKMAADKSDLGQTKVGGGSKGALNG